MRDRRLLAFTLLTMRQLGNGQARLVQDGQLFSSWHAGPQPLNTQAVRDLLNDGWLCPVPGGSGEVRIDAWPSFANTELPHSRELQA
jgi:hypothetical protein